MLKLTLSAFATQLARGDVELGRALLDAERATARDAVAAAVSLSSGSLTARELRLLGGPYARRAPQDPPDPAILNVRTGLLRRSWEYSSKPTLTGGRLRTVVTNTAPYFGYMAGTRLMVRRPIGAAINRAIFPVRIKRLREVFRKALITPK